MPGLSLSMFSPYGPRPRRSAQLVLLWMAMLIFILIVTYYLTTRQRETLSAQSATEDVPLMMGDEGKKVQGERLKNIRPPKMRHGMEQ